MPEGYGPAVIEWASALSMNNPTADVWVEAGQYDAVPGSFSLVEDIALKRNRKTAA